MFIGTHKYPWSKAWARHNQREAVPTKASSFDALDLPKKLQEQGNDPIFQMAAQLAVTPSNRREQEGGRLTKQLVIGHLKASPHLILQDVAKLVEVGHGHFDQELKRFLNSHAPASVPKAIQDVEDVADWAATLTADKQQQLQATIGRVMAETAERERERKKQVARQKLDAAIAELRELGVEVPLADQGSSGCDNAPTKRLPETPMLGDCSTIFNPALWAATREGGAHGRTEAVYCAIVNGLPLFWGGRGKTPNWVMLLQDQGVQLEQMKNHTRYTHYNSVNQANRRTRRTAGASLDEIALEALYA